MALDQKRIDEIVGRVVGRVQRGEAAASFNPLTPGTPAGASLAQTAAALVKKNAPPPSSATASHAKPPVSTGDEGIHPDMNSAVAAARWAHQQLMALAIADKERIIANIRRIALENAEYLSQITIEETGMGRMECKIAKHQLIAQKTPGTEDLQPTAWTGDNGLTLVEYAPYGVIGAITPSTNPTSTIICNAIGMIAACNGVVFNSHPGAKKCSEIAVRLINRAVREAGGPPCILNSLAEPTIKSAQEMMKHPEVNILMVTGGPAVVKVAMGMGKKAICAGDGNPPAVVDETADPDQAGRDLVIGAGFDNNVVCVLEKEIIAVDSIADKLKAAMKAHGAVEIQSWQLSRLEKVIFNKQNGPRKEAEINKKFVGKSPHVILKEIGVSAGPEAKLILAETSVDDPLVWTEQLMPVIPLVRVRNVHEAIDLAVEAEGGRRHTATMHSKNIDMLTKMARAIKTSIFVKNGPSIAGLGYGGQGFASFSIASPTGEGLTSAKNFARIRRCVVVDSFRIV
ncbi:MAG: aldehyde dehydrogenase EutE [Bradymonadales bacterium]|nr:aldehyde dehydrogenase EutE [Bradymonadales bacterium]